MRFRDKNEPLHHPILKPANLPDFLTVARKRWQGVVRGIANVLTIQALRKRDPRYQN